MRTTMIAEMLECRDCRKLAGNSRIFETYCPKHQRELDAFCHGSVMAQELGTELDRE